jgi:hypothetical protein
MMEDEQTSHVNGTILFVTGGVFTILVLMLWSLIAWIAGSPQPTLVQVFELIGVYYVVMILMMLLLRRK